MRALGFIDVNPQGDGPDGGLDLIATESLGFAIQGPRSFRWGVQCKFSLSGTRRSVGDAEIRDVEGILRSDRYSAHKLQGYMVVTNRRVSQNVVERLRGIDRESPFRCCHIDGVRLEQFLLDFPHLITKYFGEVKRATSSLGKPIITTPAATETLFREKTTRQYFIRVQFGVHNRLSPLIEGTIDLAASMSCVDSYILELLESHPVETAFTHTLSGNMRIPIHVVDLYVAGVKIAGARVCAVKNMSFPFLLGGDELSNWVCLVDGPNQNLKLWFKGSKAT